MDRTGRELDVMTGPEHYREAECELSEAKAQHQVGRDAAAAMSLKFAAIHQGLALTAATAANIRCNGALTINEQRAAFEEWAEAIS